VAPLSNGVMPIQADPSYVSIGIASGTTDRNVAAGIGQWANSRSTQLWPMIHGPRGSSNGGVHSLERCALASGGGDRRRHMAPWT
jgi:hypothetical protein